MANQITGFLKVQYPVKEVWYEINFLYADTALQINMIPLPVIMNKKIKKPMVKLSFWWS